MESLKKKGIFIAFEGIDGSGKSTQLRMLSDRLKATGLRCYTTREPTDSPIGSLIHQIMTGRMSADNRVLASLFAADRADHLLNDTDGICSKIDDGITVLTDRYYFSSYAYHSVDMDMDWVISANSLCADILRPSITVFLDLPVAMALERIRRDRFQTELFEKEERLIQVRDNYFAAFERLKNVENIAVIDAAGTAGEISDSIWRAVAHLF